MAKQMRLEKHILNAIIESAQEELAKMPDGKIGGPDEASISNIRYVGPGPGSDVRYSFRTCFNTYNDSRVTLEECSSSIRQTVDVTLKCMAKSIAKKVFAKTQE